MQKKQHIELLVGLVWAGLIPSAMSQQAPSDAAAVQDRLEDIVVTANKREESINKVGATVTELGGPALAERRISSLQDVAGAIPGLAFAQSADNTPILTLRGIGFNASTLGAYPAVSVYIDQAPLPFAVLASHSAYDLQRIEVLKGPQGTLFGANSTGGAINYIAAKPTSVFEAGGDISYGRFNQIETNAYIGGPIADTVRGRVAITGTNSDGWQQSVTRPYDTNGKLSFAAGRGLLDWDASQSIRVSLNVNGWHDTSQPQAGQFIALNPQTPATTQPQELTYPFPPQTPRAADWSTGIQTPRSDRTFYQAALRADFDLTSDLVLTSLTSYDHFTQTQATDGEGSALVVSDLSADDGYIQSINQELRVSNSVHNDFRWVLGGNLENTGNAERQRLNYQDDSNSNAAEFYLRQNDPILTQQIKNYAFFGNTEFDVAPQWTLKAAARYTDSRNNASSCEVDSGDGLLNLLFNTLGNELGTVPFTPLSNANPANQRCVALTADNVPSVTPVNETLHEHNISWRGGVDYHVTGDALIYINASRGYKAGSFPIISVAATSQYRPVTQESVIAYETGLKWQFWDQRAQLNAAAFYYRYDNKQILGKELIPLFGLLDVLVNVPESRVIGSEAELTIKPFQGMTVTSALTYLDSEIENYSGPNAVGENENFAGSALPFAPKWAYSLGGEYRFWPMGNGSPYVGMDVQGQTATDTAVGGSNIVIPPGANVRVLPGLLHPFTTNSYALLNARVGYGPADGRWNVMLWGKNLANKYYWNNVVTSSDYTARYAGLPATYGVAFSFKVR